MVRNDREKDPLMGEPEPDLDALVGELLENVRNVDRLAVVVGSESLPATGGHD